MLSHGAAAPFVEDVSVHDATPKESLTLKAPQRAFRQLASATPQEVCIKAETVDLSPELLVKLEEQREAEERAAAKRRPKTLSKEERRIAAAASAAAPWKAPESTQATSETRQADLQRQLSREDPSALQASDADEDKTSSAGEAASYEKKAAVSASDSAAPEEGTASAGSPKLDETPVVASVKKAVALRHRYTPL